MKRAVLVIALVAAPLLADEVRLKGGGRLTGQITDQTAENVTIDIGAGTMTVPMSTVTGIDKGTSPLHEYRDRAAALAADDVEGWRQLGRFANEKGLSVQAREAYSKVHAMQPDDLDANRALGLVQYQGRWVTEEESYQARGFVKFGGEWMTPAERTAIEQEEHNRRETNRQAVKEQVVASEAERKEREAKEAAEEEERRKRNQLPTLGDWNWGWGYAVPTVWHE